MRQLWGLFLLITQLVIAPGGQSRAESVPVIPVPIACGRTIDATLCAAGEVDTYSFALPATTEVSIQASDRFGSIGLLRLQIVDEAGLIVGETCTGRIQMPLRLGPYRLRVSDCVGTDAGSYSVTMLTDRGLDSPVRLVATRDGSSLYVITGGALAVYDFANPARPRLVDHFPVGEALSAVRLSSDESKAFVLDWKGNFLSVVDTETRRVVSRHPSSSGPRDLAVGSDGRNAYIVNCNGYCGTPPYELGSSIVLVRPDGPPVTAPPTLGSSITVPGYGGSGLALSPDGSLLYLFSRGDGVVVVADTATNEFFATIPIRSRPPFVEAAGGIVASPDGRHVFVLDAVSGLSVIDVQRMEVVRQIDFSEPDFVGQETRVNDMAVSPDGAVVYVTFDTPETGLSWLWAIETETGATRAVYFIGSGFLPSVALAADGTRAYCGTVQSGGGIIATLALPSGTPISSFTANVPLSPQCSPFTNDRCEQAKEIRGESFVGFLDAGSMKNATRDSTDPVPTTCAERREYPANVWYRFTAPADGIVTADTIGSTFDTILVGYRGTCGALEEITCNDDAFIEGAGIFIPSLTAIRVRGGETYSFVVHGYGTFGLGSFSLVFQPDVPTALPTPITPCEGTQLLRSACPGDCNGDRRVEVSEIVRGLDEDALAKCPAIDSNSDSTVRIDDLVRAVSAALEGCAQ